jgi:acid phosphatase (class A)
MRTLVIVALASVGLASVVIAQGLALPPEFRAYLPETIVHADAFPPASGASKALDKRVYHDTRALENGSRWTLAQADGGKGVLKAFSCAAGVSLDNQNVPALGALLSRYRTDLINATKLASPLPRPYETYRGKTCLITPQALRTAGGTPMLQAAWGWSVALILTGALPRRAVPLMQRGLAYGESAAICGLASATETGEGRDLGAAMLARAEADPAFAADLAKARGQVAAVAASPAAIKPEACEAEANLIRPAF